jgi:hypothetical protein
MGGTGDALDCVVKFDNGKGENSVNMKYFNKTSVSLGVAATLLGAVATVNASPVPYPTPGTQVPVGDILYASGGDVTVTYLGKGPAVYTDLLYLSSPGSAYNSSANPIFNSQVSAVNSTVDLGNFTAGTELIFGLFVQNTGATWYTGPGALNSDGAIHGYVVNSYPTAGSTYVGFEDEVLGGTDWNYTDLQFDVSGASGAVPETSSTMALLGMGLSGLALAGRRFKK